MQNATYEKGYRENAENGVFPGFLEKLTVSGEPNMRFTKKINKIN